MKARIEPYLSRMLQSGSRMLSVCRSYAWLLLVVLVAVAQGQTTQTTPLSPANAAAQNPPAAQSPASAQGSSDASAPTVRSTTDEVSLDLVVHDKHHKPILDLKAEDIAVTDNDVPVKLNGFRLVKGDQSEGHMVTLVFDRFEGPMAKTSRTIAEKVLKALPTTGFSFAVLDFNGRLRLLQGFTQDRNEVEQAIVVETENRAIHMVSTLSQGVDISRDPTDAGRTKAAADAEKSLILTARTGVDLAGKHVDLQARAKAQMLLKALQDTQLIAQDQHTATSLAGILALVQAQQQISERKAIIYFTQNVIMDSASKEMLKTISGAATKAGVTIYTVDLDAMNVTGRHEMVNALMNGQQPFNPAPVNISGDSTHPVFVTPMQQQSAMPAGTQTNGGGAQSWGSAQTVAMAGDFMRGNNEDRNQYLDIKSPMSDLAKDTGGLYIDAQVSLSGPLQQLAEDMTTYYQASYTPPIQEYDGKFRAIGIKPIRAGIGIQAKTGYFALPPDGAVGIRPFEAPLLKALAASQLLSEFKFNAAILRFGELPDGNTNTLAIEVPFAELNVKKDAQTNLYAAHVSIVAEVKDSAGTVIEHFGQDIARRGALESLDRDNSMAISMQRHFMEIPGKYLLEVAVVDRNGDKTSAQRIPFEIPSESSGPALSDIVLVGKMDAFKEDADPFEPLRYESAKVTPNLSGRVPHDAKSVSLFLILRPDPKLADTPTLEMQVIHDGKAGRRTPLPLHLSSAGATTPYLATFGKSLASGNYVVKATLNQGGIAATKEISFTVEGQPGEAVVAPSAVPVANAGPVDAMAIEIAPAAPGQLVIARAANPLPPPTPEEAQALIADARERALGYKKGLPNFMCVEQINRSLDLSGKGNWQHRDTITELMRFHDKQESRVVLEVDGRRAASSDPDSIRGAQSTGEFGGVLSAIFEPSAKAEFHWKETDTLSNSTVQVFDYRVLKENSAFSVRGSNGLEPTVGFHGKIFIESATRSVRRVSLIAEDVPKDFPTHASSISVDYDYVAINSHDYLLPISAEVSMLEGRHEGVLNTIEFRDYKRFGSNSKITYVSPEEKP